MTKKLIFIILLFITILLSGCFNEGNYPKHETYPYPTKNKPKDILLEPTFMDGENLSFVEEFVFTMNVNTIDSKFKNGIISTYEEFISYDFNLELDEDYFDDKFIVGQIRMFQKGFENRKFLNSVYKDNMGSKTIFIYTKYLKTNLGESDRYKTNVYLYAFDKEDINLEEYSVFFSSMIDTYVDPSTYLYLYFNLEEGNSFKKFYKNILKEYKLDKYFYVDFEGERSIKLRVSDKEVESEIFEEVFGEFLSDKRVSYYYVENRYYNYYERKVGSLNGEIIRDGLYGFNLNYKYDNSYQDNALIVKSKTEYDNLVWGFMTHLKNESNDFDLYNPENIDAIIEYMQEKYSDEFFLENNLVMFGITEGSGSISHLITDVIKEDVKVKIEMLRIVPTIGTQDMAYYTAYISVPKETEELEIAIKNIWLESDQVVLE